jgi:hypothetical protein
MVDSKARRAEEWFLDHVSASPEIVCSESEVTGRTIHEHTDEKNKKWLNCHSFEYIWIKRLGTNA